MFSPNETVYSVSVGGGFACFNLDSGIKCFGNNHDSKASTPWIYKPNAIVTAVDFSCALTQGEVKCWGTEKMDIELPFLDNPILLGGGYSTACAWDKTGLKCWGSDFIAAAGLEMNAPKLPNPPTELVVWGKDACAVSAQGLVCWGASWDSKKAIEWKNPADLSLVEGILCAITSEGAKCVNSQYQSINPPNADKSIKTVVGYQKYIFTPSGYLICSLDKEGLVDCSDENGKALMFPIFPKAQSLSVGFGQVCVDAKGTYVCGEQAGDHLQQLPYKSPKIISLSPNYGCGIDQYEAYCWGWNLQGTISPPLARKPPDLKRPSNNPDDSGV
jgi:hypothetical protein